ncbi:MAG: hypothetical protein GY718_03070 [Lentisphaerae bacterium]|nr:hypothetical protein [Lentisphaerota bacterium]
MRAHYLKCPAFYCRELTTRAVLTCRLEMLVKGALKFHSFFAQFNVFKAPTLLLNPNKTLLRKNIKISYGILEVIFGKVMSWGFENL